ncbi:RING-H2 finger C2A [Wolffia australiana]
MAAAAVSAAATPYWCYRCSRFVRVPAGGAVVCPDCESGFVERVEPPPAAPRRRRPAAAAMYMLSSPRRGAARAPFNPVIVLRGPAGAGGLELFYDDGSGAGLRPLPAAMSELLMGSGFDRLLDQLALLELHGAPRGFDHPPAAKAAVESMPTVEIGDGHVAAEAHCAVCKEAFELGCPAREMPCRHLYHEGCIFPWLAVRNSCPVCRHEMPAEPRDEDEDAAAVGLTIWRLPGGGFAVGRFAAERELPAVYTEVDGGANAGGPPRRVAWSTGGGRGDRRRSVSRAIRGAAAFLGRLWRSSSSSGARI